MAGEMNEFFGSAQGHSAGSDQALLIFNQFQLHSDIDERDLLVVQEVRNQLACRWLIDTNKDEIESCQLLDCIIAKMPFMRNDSATHLAIDAGVVSHLGQLLVQDIKRRRAGCAECIVLKELVSVEQMNLSGMGFGY